MITGWLSDDAVARCLVLFAVVVIGSIGFDVGSWGYAWLLVCITFGMVLLSSLPNPITASSFGIDRIIEVMMGTGAAIGLRSC